MNEKPDLQNAAMLRLSNELEDMSDALNDLTLVLLDFRILLDREQSQLANVLSRELLDEIRRIQ